jgi:hypothetical protein
MEFLTQIKCAAANHHSELHDVLIFDSNGNDYEIVAIDEIYALKDHLVITLKKQTKK